MKKSGCGPIVLIIIVAALLLSLIGSCDSGSSHSNEPWRDLGVSKREYMQVYNYYKYGEWG